VKRAAAASRADPPALRSVSGPTPTRGPGAAPSPGEVVAGEVEGGVAEDLIPGLPAGAAGADEDRQQDGGAAQCGEVRRVAAVGDGVAAGRADLLADRAGRLAGARVGVPQAPFEQFCPIAKAAASAPVCSCTRAVYIAATSTAMGAGPISGTINSAPSPRRLRARPSAAARVIFLRDEIRPGGLAATAAAGSRVLSRRTARLKPRRRRHRYEPHRWRTASSVLPVEQAMILQDIP
jgi:hypothetical protein